MILKSFQYFLRHLEVERLNRKPYKLPVQAYAVDKSCGKDGIKLKDQFEMGHFHSCDYILAKENKDKVLLIEDSNLGEQKKDLEDKCFRFMQNNCTGKIILDKQAKEELSEKIMKKIRDENRLKAYASLLLLCHLISKDAYAKKLIGGKEVHFWVIVTDGVASDFEAFADIGSRLGGCLRPLVSGVAFLPLKEAKQKLSKWG